MSYTKLHRSLIQSSIWTTGSDPLRLVWVTMLALADERGIVESSIPGLAHAAVISLKQCEEALGELLAPDPYSRRPDHDGRRIEAVPGGWRLLSYEHYRSEEDLERRRESDRLRQERRRAKLASRDAQLSSRDSNVKSRQAEAEAEAEAEARRNTEERSAGSGAVPVPPTYSEDAVKRARALLNAIILWKPNHRLATHWTEAKLMEWAGDLDQLHRVDGVEWSRVDAIIAWLPTNGFWAKNVQSGRTLREKFDRLEAEVTAPPEQESASISVARRRGCKDCEDTGCLARGDAARACPLEQEAC